MSGEVEQGAVAAEEPVAQEPIEQAATEVAETETVERDVEQDTLEIPDSAAEGGKVSYVNLNALKGARKEISELRAQLNQAKEGSAKAQQLEQRIDELGNQIAQIAPKAQAYDAAVAAQNQYREPVAEDDTEAVELAQTLDLYTPEGKPDLVKAKKALAVMGKLASKEADSRVAPLAQHTIQSMSNVMLARAKTTVAKNGAKPDPKVLEQVWGRLDPRLTATVEGATQAWNAALGFTKAMEAAEDSTPQRARTETGQFTKGDIAPPLHTEKAGGKDTPDGGLALNDKEKAYMKKAGISEKEYLESARNAPWLRR